MPATTTVFNETKTLSRQILELVYNHPEGLTNLDVTDQLEANRDMVRATLNKFAKRGLILRDNKLWRPARPTTNYYAADYSPTLNQSYYPSRPEVKRRITLAALVLAALLGYLSYRLGLVWPG